MATEIEVCQAFINDCVRRHIEKQEMTILASMAKAKASEMLGFVTDQGLQLHGGYGYMNEYPISKAYVDARVERIFGGTTEIMKEIIARDILS
jgi:alkylation response protein AidB-like acyl-CoA dehydrogenase